MRDLRTLAERDLCHGVGEVIALPEAHERLDQRHLCLLAGNDERPRVSHDWISVIARDVHDVNRRRERPVRPNEHSIAEERRVQSNGGVVPRLAIPAEVPMHKALFVAHSLRYKHH